jgi:hypothetical protein
MVALDSPRSPSPDRLLDASRDEQGQQPCEAQRRTCDGADEPGLHNRDTIATGPVSGLPWDRWWYGFLVRPEVDLEALSTPEHGYTISDEHDELVGTPDPQIVGRALED